MSPYDVRSPRLDHLPARFEAVRRPSLRGALVVLASLGLLACEDASSGETSPRVTANLLEATHRGGADAPRLWAGRSGSDDAKAEPAARALGRVRELSLERGADEAARDATFVRSVGKSRVGTFVQLRQRLDGIELLGRRMTVLVDATGALRVASGSLAPSVGRAPNDGTLDAAGALERVLARAGLGADRSALVPGASRGDFTEVAWQGDSPAPMDGPALARAVWLEDPAGLRSGWQLLLTPRGGTAREYVVFSDGTVVPRGAQEASLSFDYRVWADAEDGIPADGPLEDVNPHPTGTPDGFSPSPVAPALVSMDGFNAPKDPWLPGDAASTTGNNVIAYTDDGPTGFTVGDSYATTTSAQTFDRTLDQSLEPYATLDQSMAVITQAFYTTNWLHDYWYDSGFDEVAGNVQEDNYGRGGSDGDPLLVEVQNGGPVVSDTGHARPWPEGTSPVLELSLWHAPRQAALTVDGAPFATSPSPFGPYTYDLTAPLALANDGSGDATDACTPLVNDLTGKIALVRRGTCLFLEKAQNAQSAGAIGLVIANNVPGGPIWLGGFPTPAGAGLPGPDVTIPALSASDIDGDALVAAVSAGAPMVTLQSALTGPTRDVAVDSTVVAHEWTHVMHFRLASGEFASFLAQSEGWADFLALHMGIREGDDLEGTFTIGGYVDWLSADRAYFGVRRYPYSTDMTKNPLTFGHISYLNWAGGEPVGAAGVPWNRGVYVDIDEVHSMGEVWAAMLFDAYAALIERTREQPPAYPFAEAKRRMADYVVAGMKLAPEDPTFTEQRDALLLAAFAVDTEDARALAKAFAKRGAGACAVSAPADSLRQTEIVEHFEAASAAQLGALAVLDDGASCDGDGILDAGESGHVVLELRNAGTEPLEGATLVLFDSADALAFGTAAVPTIQPLESATVSVDVSVTGAVERTATTITATVTAPDACAPEVTRSRSLVLGADEAPVATDHVDAEHTAWTLSGHHADRAWTMQLDDGRVWHGRSVGFEGKSSLVSPPIVVSKDQPFQVTFRQAFSFSQYEGTLFDGGVVEVSEDGQLWKDASEYGAVPSYGGVLSPDYDNPLGGRAAYGPQNPSYPELDEETLDFGGALAERTIQLRFTLATDRAGDGGEWILDDIAVSGVENEPFLGLGPDSCEPGAGGSGGGGGEGGGGGAAPASAAPPGDDGCDCRLGSGAPSRTPWYFGLGLGALLWRRRRGASPRALRAE